MPTFEKKKSSAERGMNGVDFRTEGGGEERKKTSSFSPVLLHTKQSKHISKLVGAVVVVGGGRYMGKR